MADGWSTHPNSYSRFHSRSEYSSGMGVSVSVLASGSRGNSTIVSSSRTKILVDAGISFRETVRRRRAAGDDPGTRSASLLPPEDCERVYGLAVLARKFQVPVFMTGASHQ